MRDRCPKHTVRKHDPGSAGRILNNLNRMTRNIGVQLLSEQPDQNPGPDMLVTAERLCETRCPRELLIRKKPETLRCHRSLSDLNLRVNGKC